MSSASLSLAALCDGLQTALSDNNPAQIHSICQQLEPPTTALINERAALLSSSPSAEADEAARPLLHTLQLLLQCAQLDRFPHTVVHVLFKAARGICTTDGMREYLTAAPADSPAAQLLFAITHYLLTCSIQCLQQAGRFIIPDVLASPPPPKPATVVPLKELKLCRLYAHPLNQLWRAYPALSLSQLPPCVLVCSGILSGILLAPPSNPHRLFLLRDYFSSLHHLVVNSIWMTLASPALHIADKCAMLDSLFPAFLLGKDDIRVEHAAAVSYLLASLLQFAPQLPAAVVDRLFNYQLPILMALLPRTHPYILLRDTLPAMYELKSKERAKETGATQPNADEPAASSHLGKLLDHCAVAVSNLLTTVLTRSTGVTLAPAGSPNTASSPPSSIPFSPLDSVALHAVRSFLWRHLLSRQPPVSRLIAMVFVHAIPRWGTTFRVQTLQTALHVLRVADRPLEELWRMEALEAVSDLLSTIFPLLSESEQQMLWSSLGVVDGLSRLAADCDVVIAFDMPAAPTRSSGSQSSSQSLTPTQTLSASPPSSQSQHQGGGVRIPLCLVIRLLCRTPLSSLHLSSLTLVSQTLIRLLVAYLQHFSGPERINSVEQLSLLLYTKNLLEWVLVSPLAFSAMLPIVTQRDVTTKVAAALSSLFGMTAPSSSRVTTDSSHKHAMTASSFIDRLQDCSPLLQLRLLLAVLGLLDTPVLDELTAAQLLRVLQGVTAIADRWPSIRWRLPALLRRACGSPTMRSPTTSPGSASSLVTAAIVSLWHILLQRPPSTATSLTDVLTFELAITQLFESTARLASTPHKSEAANLLPNSGKEEVLRLLKDWQVGTQTTQPPSPTDQQWSLLRAQRHAMDGLARQSHQQANRPHDGAAGQVGVKQEVQAEAAAEAEAEADGTSKYVEKLGELMRHNVRSREIARMLLQVRSQMGKDEWRQVRATLRDDEAEWLSLFNAVNAVV